MNPALDADGGLGVFAILGLVFLALGVLWWIKARPGIGGEGPIRLLAMRPLGGKRLVALIEVESERFLLGLTDESITCLGRLSEAQATPPVVRELARVGGERA